MGSVFKPQTYRDLPARAVIKGGKTEWTDARGRTRKAKLSKNGKKYHIESKVYFARYKDESGTLVVESTGKKDEANAKHWLAEREKLIERIKLGIATRPAIDTAAHSRTPIGDHVDAYVASLSANGRDNEYVANARRQITRGVSECEFKRLADVTRPKVEAFLASLTAAGRSANTRNGYLVALSGFLNWCVTAGRLAANPTAGAKLLNVKTDRRHQRRSLTEDELNRLLAAARVRPLADLRAKLAKMKGRPKLRPETVAACERLGAVRALIYKVQILTGLRAGELRSLTIGQLTLGGPQPHLTLDAADEKNRQGNSVPLRADLAVALRQLTTGRPLSEKLFDVPAKLSKIMNRDLKAAGIPKRDERGRVVDVHALRHTMASMMSAAGVSIRTAQAAMRHSDVKLTLGVYTDPKMLGVAGAQDALPALPLPDGTSSGTTRTAGSGCRSVSQDAGSASDDAIVELYWPAGMLAANPCQESEKSRRAFQHAGVSVRMRNGRYWT